MQRDVTGMKPDDVQRLVNELRARQTELELENEELRQAWLQLAKERDRYVNLYELAPVGYLLVDTEGLIREANLTVARLLARERVSLVGADLSQLVAEQSRDAFSLSWREALQSQTTTTGDAQMQRPGAPDLEVRFSVAVPPLYDSTGAVSQAREVLVTLWETSDRSRTDDSLRDPDQDLEAQVAERTGALEMLVDIASMANDTSDVEAAIVYALKRVSEYNGWKCGHAWLPAESDPEELIPKYVWYAEAPGRFDELRDQILRTRLKPGHGLVGRVFATGKPESTNDVGSHLSVYKAPLAEHMRVGTACAFPVLSGDERVVGVLEFFAEKDIPLTEQRLAWIATVGTLMSRVIERRQGERVLRDSEQRARRQLAELDNIYHDAPIGLCTLDRELRFTRVSHRLAEINGLSIKAHLGKRVSEVAPALAAQAAEAARRILTTGKALRNHEFIGETAAAPGVTRHYVESWYPLHDEDGGVLGFGAVIEEITKQKQTEQELKDLNRRLDERARALRRLAAEASHAEQRERAQLARLLHDNLQQLLVAARLRLSRLAGRAGNELQRDIAVVDGVLDECVSTARNLAHELNPPVLERGTIVEVINWLAKWFGDTHGLTVGVDAQDGAPAISEHVRLFLYHATRELLFNTIKHSGGTEAKVILSKRDANLTLQVEDYGSGFDPAAVHNRLRRPEGLGLFAIRERVEALGGQLEIGATSRGGASFRIITPVAETIDPLLRNA